MPQSIGENDMLSFTRTNSILKQYRLNGYAVNDSRIKHLGEMPIFFVPLQPHLMILLK